MAWIQENSPPWYHRLCMNVIKSGPVPKHVAFIMDGNRRFAKKNSIDRAQGHLMGFDKLSQTLEWCLDLGITEVTVYAFSIENFKRSKEEVDGLMELARQKFARLMQEKDMLEKHGVCIRVLGNLKLLPKDVQKIIAEAVVMTKHHNRATLNVCFSYTSRDEICHSMKEVIEGVQCGMLKNSDISEELLDKCLYSWPSPHPDMLLRTSGEVRLSDFLLWQSTFSILSFMEVLWPEFSRWHLYAGILHYQRNYQAVKDTEEKHLQDRYRQQRESDYKCLIKDNTEMAPKAGLQQRLEEYAQTREKRIQHFISHVQQKRNKYFDDLCSDNNVVTVS